MTHSALTLFPISGGSARHSDPISSVQAARAQRFSGIPAAILEVFDGFQIGALTDDEICERLSWAHPPTVKSARSRLSRAGLLVDSGVRRASDTGHTMICWRLVETSIGDAMTEVLR